MNDGNSIDRSAAHWAARALRGLTPAERLELDAWRKADPRHAGSYLRAMALERLAADSLERLAATGGLAQRGPDDGLERPDDSIERPRDDARRDREAWHSGATTRTATAAQTEASPLSRRQLIRGALAASLAGGVGMAGYRHLRAGDRVVSARGEIRNVAMSDGSAVVLGTDSTIAISMTVERRSIELEQGQAWFDVAHDARRPFEVHHAGLRVRATGTAFQVASLPGGVEVLVSEGSVALLRDGSDTPIARLRAGDHLAYVDALTRAPDGDAAPRRGAVERLDAAAVERRLAWRQGMIVLDGEPLADAVAQVNRYNATPIRIVDPALADRRVYGTFRARDPEGFARALAIALDARAEITADSIDLK